MQSLRRSQEVRDSIGCQPFPAISGLSAPPGLYGHSAVYHEATDSLYVFGGFRFHVELAAPSPELYSLHCPDGTWSLLAPSQGAKVRTAGCHHRREVPQALASPTQVPVSCPFLSVPCAEL